MKAKISLLNLGYDEFFETNRKKLGLDGFAVARVIAQYKGAYKIKNEKGEYLGKITGKQIFKAASRENYPAVGDWVLITEADAENAVINSILPRKTIIKRNRKGEIQVIAANVDVAFIVESFDRDYNLNRFERYFSLAKDGGVVPSIILNKSDLITKEEFSIKEKEISKRFKDTDFILTSAATSNGIDKLEGYIEKGKTYCFLGSSGVGKSTLINKLIGEDIIKINEISAYSERGKHTTTRREMFFLKNGGILIDNPGMRQVGMADTTAGIDKSFDEISNLAKKCKYQDCTHMHEPGCKVLEMLDSGELDKAKYSNYVSLKKEAEYYSMSKSEKREKDKRFGKFIKTSKKELKKLE